MHQTPMAAWENFTQAWDAPEDSPSATVNPDDFDQSAATSDVPTLVREEHLHHPLQPRQAGQKPVQTGMAM